MTGDIKFSWDSGLQNFLKNIASQPEKMKKALPKALFREAEELMAEAKPLVPVDHGFLRASGHVQLPEFDGEKVSVVAGFGGVAGSGNQGNETNNEDVGYAIVVHEDLTKNHTVGQAKFLETPFEARKADMGERLSQHIKDNMES